jgi:hypothetical protein
MLPWYHDQAMGISRFNVDAGLAGLWLTRVADEDALGLPSDAYEVPLLIQDRNLETAPDGNSAGDCCARSRTARWSSLAFSRS